MTLQELVENIKAGLKANETQLEEHRVKTEKASRRYEEIFPKLQSDITQIQNELISTGVLITTDDQPRCEDLNSQTFSTDVQFMSNERSLRFLRTENSFELLVRVYPLSGPDFRAPIDLMKGTDDEVLECFGDFLSDAMGVSRVTKPYPPKRRIRNIDLS